MQTPSIPEHLPGEPLRERPPAPQLALKIAGRALMIALLSWLTLGLWPIYLLAAAIWGWPPNVPRLGQVRRYLRLIQEADPPPPGLSATARLLLTLAVLRKCATIPVWGLAWLIDEALYGRRLEAVVVAAPLIEISAGRSGSTQLARYLEDDPNLAAPSLLQFLFPYLWLWRLAPALLGRWLTPERVREQIESRMPPEFLERHEGDPFRTDTFDGALYISHLNHLAPFLGPGPMVEDFAFGRMAPHNRALWEQIFPELLDRIARKTLLYAGPGPGGAPRRFFVKGHFLAAADALERRYPDARFLAMIREPAPRLQSAINYLRVNPFDEALGQAPWGWLAEALTRTESEYCENEQRWFTREGGARRCVIRFSDYVRDLEGAMSKVYRECLDAPELPPHVPRAHPPRERTRYTLNRSLSQLGIDEAALNQRLAAYIIWCKGA